MSIYEKVAKKIANEVGGKYYPASRFPIDCPDNESWVVESKHKKDWTVAYAFNEANNDPNQKYVLEPYDDYKLIVAMHIVEAQRILKEEA